MKTTTDTDEKKKNISYLQYRIAQKFSMGEDVLSLLPSADIATCLYILEQFDVSDASQFIYH
jgi:hypothetical protein